MPMVWNGDAVRVRHIIIDLILRVFLRCLNLAFHIKRWKGTLTGGWLEDVLLSGRSREEEEEEKSKAESKKEGSAFRSL